MQGNLPLKNKVTSYEQQMDHVMSNFGNINCKAELEMKASFLEKENFELRDQLIDKLLIIKQLKTDLFPTDVSTTTNTITTPAQTNDKINSNVMIITKTTITKTTSTTITVKTRTITTTTTKMKRTIIALMKRQFTTKRYKHNCRKFERKNLQIF